MSICPTRVSDNGRFLVKADGQPFLWFADTAWELFHRLNREDAAHYLQRRAEQKFTLVQAVILGEFYYLLRVDRAGQLPFVENKGP